MGTSTAVSLANISARLAILLRTAAPLLLILSIATRLAWGYLMPYTSAMIDLHVYVGGAAAIDHPGTLYSYAYTDQTPDFAMPFTYPPFAAVVFYPLHLLPFGGVALLWQIATIAALYGGIRLSQRLLGSAASAVGKSHRIAMLWTAGAIWVEPVHNTLDVGQVNVLLMWAALWAVYTTRWWLSGLLVGLAAGVKLTPAITGLYFLGVRRWAAAVFSAVVFLVTVAVSVLVVGDQAHYYFTELLGDAHRVGPVGNALNQSWRGGLSRVLGHDAGSGPLVLAAIAITAVLAVLAWRALGTCRTAEPTRPDQLGRLLIVELFGLLSSPISWTHHWVWLVPLMIWLIHGPLRARRGAQILGWGWLALMILQVPWALASAQPTFWQIERPWYLAWAGLVYIVATLMTLIWIAVSGRKNLKAHSPTSSAVPASLKSHRSRMRKRPIQTRPNPSS